MTAYYNEHDPYAAAWLRELVKAGLVAPGDVDERSIADVRPDDVRGYVQCHFFGGVGGWSLALRLAGWPDAEPAWTGSCPCQPLSSAGKKLGERDARHLWPEFHRLVGECRPLVVLGEQVASKDGLEWLDGISLDLEELGYAVGAVDLPAAGVGAPHVRQRFFWVADAEDPGRRGVAGFAEAEERRAVPQAGGRGGPGGVGDALVIRLGEPQHPGDVGRAPGAEPEHGGQDRREGPVGSSPTGGSWSDFALVPCRDGRTRRVGVRLQWMAYGLSDSLGTVRTDCDAGHEKAVEEEMIHAKQGGPRPDQALQAVRQPAVPEADALRATGGHGGVRSPGLLRSEVHGGCDGGRNQSPDSPQQPETVSQGKHRGLLGLRDREELARPSCGREPAQQRPVELEDVVRAMPQAYALAALEGDIATAEALQVLFPSVAAPRALQHALFEAAKTWKPPRREEVERAWRAGLLDGFRLTARSPLTATHPGRAALLRGFGNAIVPEAAAEFVRAYRETRGLTP